MVALATRSPSRSKASAPQAKNATVVLVSVREQVESSESFVIQVWWPDSRRVTDGTLAHVRTPGGSTRPTKSCVRLSWSPPNLRACAGLTRSNRRVRTRTHGGVGGAEPKGSPLSRSLTRTGLRTVLVWCKTFVFKFQVFFISKYFSALKAVCICMAEN
jgi:hypothetical protein